MTGNLKFLAVIIFISATCTTRSFSEENNKPEARFSGFIRSDVIYDTRQSHTLRESAIMLYPLNEDLSGGTDLNDNPMFTMLVLHTRLRWDFRGPDALGAKTTAAVEGEFFGSSNFDVNGFRLRHAYVNLDWDGIRLMIGQYWNPLFITEVLPAHNFCSPYLAYGRRPQLRLSAKPHQNIGLSATASVQSDFKSLGPGPDGKPAYSTSYIKNAAMPSLNFNAKYISESLVFGFGADYKRLEPELAKSPLDSYAGTLFLKLDYSPVAIKFQGIYGQNLTDVVMLGGYAVSEADTNEYTNYNTLSIWGEISYGKDIMINLLAGYTKNLGTVDAALPNPALLYARGTDIDNSLRIAPSLIINSGKVRIVGETEYTSAAYGAFKNEKLNIGDTKIFSNLRYNIAVYYFI